MITNIPFSKVFILSEENSILLDAVDKLVDKGRRVNVLVTGDQGSGKSELVIQYAATRNRPLATLEVGRLNDPSQIFGYMELKDNRTTFVKGLFTEAITTPGCVIHLQEINRSENDKALNAMFSILDDTSRNIWIDELGDYITVAPGVVIFATMNEGYEFIGTQPLDPALANRFHIKIAMRYLPPEYERMVIVERTGVNFQIASNLVAMAQALRNNDQHPIKVSTRDLIAVGDLMSVGVPRLLALVSALGSDPDTLETILLQEHLVGETEEVDNGLQGYKPLSYNGLEPSAPKLIQEAPILPNPAEHPEAVPDLSSLLRAMLPTKEVENG